MNPNDNCKVHLVEPEFGPPYYRKFAFCSDGNVVSGHGMTYDAAEMDAAREVQLRENYLALPDIERLKILMQGSLLDTDKQESIRIMAKLLIETYELQTSFHSDKH
jgi:hypothetical protein